MREAFRIERKNKLLQAASEVFAEKGYAGTTILDVAKRAGMGKGTVYGYFASKEDLFFDLFYWYAQEVMSGLPMDFPEDGQPLKDVFLGLVEVIVEGTIASVDMYPLTLEFWAAAASGNLRDRIKEAFATLYEEFRELIGSLIQKGVDEGEFRADTNIPAISAGIMGAMDACGLQYWMDTSFDVRSAVYHTISAILTGISNPPEPQGRG